MQPTSTICRAQESLHLAKAADAFLPNVRDIAIQAAQAWAKEAAAAEQREERQSKARAMSSISLGKVGVDYPALQTEDAD